MTVILEASDLSTRVFRETRRAVDKFGKYSEKELRRIKNIYIGARKRISGEIAEQWPDVVKSGTTPFGMERLRGLQLSIDTQLGVLNQDLSAAIPQMVGDAGDMGIYRGQVELAQLLREFPDIHPTFGIMNTSAIDVYSGYALQLSQQYTAELTRQIQSALQMGLLDQKTTGQLVTQIRQYMGAEYGKPAKAITYKARRIVRTEMSQAFQAGHEAYGRSTDYIVGEVAHHNPMGPWPCAQCENIPEGTEFIYAAGDAPPYPLHPNCRCMDADTELFTDDGWKFFKDLTGQEMVLSLEPDSFDLEWQPIAKIHSYPHSGKLLRFKSKICDLLVTPDHSMFAGCYSSSKATKRKARIYWKFKSAESLKNRAVFKLLKTVKRQEGSETNFAIGKAEIDARLYAKLLGYHLSEGSICKHGRGWYQISIYQNNQERKKKIFEDLMGLPWKIHNHKNKIDIYSHELAEHLIQFGQRSFERFVPLKLKECSADILDVFLDAFCLGDGWIRKGGIWHGGKTTGGRAYGTSSKRLADDLGEIILRTGKYPSYSLYKLKGTKKMFPAGEYEIKHDHWAIRENKSKGTWFCKGGGIRITEEEYNGMVYDVTLPKNHTLWVRRNGRTVWTGNCYTTYIYSKKLFTKEEMGKLRGMTPEAPGPSKPVGKIPKGRIPTGKPPKGRIPSGVKGKVPKVEPLTYGESVDSESRRILRAGLRTKNEHGVAINAKGKVIMKRPGKRPDFVDITQSDHYKMVDGKAKIFIHNHPGGASFSPGDVEFARYYNLDEMMAVGKEYKYVIKPGPGGWPKEGLKEIEKLHDSLMAATKTKYNTLWHENPKIEWQEFFRRQSHEAMEDLSKKLGLTYKRSVW